MGFGNAAKMVASRLVPNRIIVSGNPRNSSIALTFDDGPHPENTPQLLDILDQYNVKATFFLQGTCAEKFGFLVRDIDARGHQIGNHGYSHLDARLVDPRIYLNDALRCQSLLEDCVGKALFRDFRPPFGRITTSSAYLILKNSFRLIFWSIDTMDSYVDSDIALLKRLRETDIRPGSILLFHDDYRHTIDAMPSMLEHICSLGRDMVLLEQLAGCVRRH